MCIRDRHNSVNTYKFEENLAEMNKDEEASFNGEDVECAETDLSEDIVKNAIATDELLCKMLNKDGVSLHEPTKDINEVLTNLFTNINRYIKKTRKYKAKLKRLKSTSMQENYKEKLEQVIIELENRREELLAELGALKERISAQSMENAKEANCEELNKVKTQINNARAELNCLLDKKENEMRIIEKLRNAEDELKERLRYVESFINQTEKSFKGLERQHAKHKIQRKTSAHNCHITTSHFKIHNK
eukprot:TRINITY_DN5758_c0_g3_i2.p1 TRINITY_DN5758_c0_g3~~TRINITY_DN5758_c0_g3_i2.p1  ORF type:complete len:247 (-),score=58.95 TRINITY_DN5758_c0_g3_i2:966-1706(-)